MTTDQSFPEYAPVTRHLLDFVDTHGGPSEVARVTGTKPAWIYLLRSGKNKKPSTDTLDLMRATYPDFDRHASANPSPAVTVDAKNLAAENERLRQTVEKQEGKIERLETRLEKAYNDLAEVSKSFTTPGSQSPAYMPWDREPVLAQSNQDQKKIGFEYGKEAAVQTLDKLGLIEIAGTWFALPVLAARITEAVGA